MNPIKKFKAMTTREKMMFIIIILLIICIITRWNFIKKEAGEAFKVRIERIKGNGDGLQENAPASENTNHEK